MDIALDLLNIAFQASATILAADLTSGLIHWAEDTFFTEETPLIGRLVIQPNALHHRDGYAFTKLSWIESSWDLLALGSLIALTAARTHHLTWQLGLFLILSVNANQFHKWAHVNPSKVPAWVRSCQKLGLLQHPKHHAVHHRGAKNTHYCVITEYANPVLDRVGAWRLLDRVAAALVSVPRRTDIQTR